MTSLPVDCFHPTRRPRFALLQKLYIISIYKYGQMIACGFFVINFFALFWYIASVIYSGINRQL